MNKIFIHTAAVHSGKTTNMFRFAAKNQNVDGILQPVIENKRFLYHINSRQLRLLEIDNPQNENDIMKIGKFKFSKETFAWAQKILTDSFQKKFNWLVIDEIGPLEIEGKGYEPALSKILLEYEKFNGNILLVVRKELLEKVKTHYNLGQSFHKFEVD